MKKRIEKIVECIYGFEYLTIGKKYQVHSETKGFYSIMADDGNIGTYFIEKFKVVSEREVLEFEGDVIRCRDSQVTLELMQDLSNIDLTNYDIKVIATPKDKTYEEMSKEELIKLLKAKE